jgi:hypothetical protein
LRGAGGGREAGKGDDGYGGETGEHFSECPWLRRGVSPPDPELNQRANERTLNGQRPAG